MQRDPTYPSEWPDHLRSDTTITPFNVTPPLGRCLLDLPALGPVGFEQFCWWLLQREGKSLLGCKRLGGSGHAQGGIDIFASEAHDPDRLIVYECKSGKGFSPTDLKDAVTKFLAGEWLQHTSTFVLLLAKESLEGPLSNAWITQKQRLRKKGIDADVWTAHELTMRAQAFPDILSKFFPTYDVHHYANIWMQRTAFLEELRRGVFDPREHVANWARKLASMAASDSVESVESRAIGAGNDVATISRFGNNWVYKCPWFDLNAYLPVPRSPTISASITLHRPDVTGLVIVLPQEWMIKRLLFSTGAPLTHEHRGFIAGPALWKEDGSQVVDLGLSRLTIDDLGVRAISDAADALSAEVRRSLIELEQDWDASDFVFVNFEGKKVALAAIREDVWHEVLRFARIHSVSAGETEWHMFDPATHVLKPYTEETARHGNRFDHGYHGVFRAEYLPELCRDGEVVVLWQPPWEDESGPVSARAWWSCKHAFQWLSFELLPEVRRWIFQGNFGSPIRRLLHPIRARRFAGQLEEVVVSRDLRRQCLGPIDEMNGDVVRAIEVLQHFFARPQSPSRYLVVEEVEALFLAAAQLAELKRGYLGYVRSNLGLKDDPAAHTELVQSILRHVHDGRVVANSAVVDHALRAILELLDSSFETVPMQDRRLLVKALTPFVHIHDEAMLVLRHYGS